VISDRLQWAQRQALQISIARVLRADDDDGGGIALLPPAPAKRPGPRSRRQRRVRAEFFKDIDRCKSPIEGLQHHRAH
jgi:hypothetical protein